jgi:hypothetical protein
MTPTHREPDLRALDLRLARALGLKIYQRDDGWWYYIPSGKPRRTHERDAVPVPRYSTDGTAMLALWAEMQKRGWWGQVRTPFDDDEKVYWAGFTQWGFTGWNGRPDYPASGETAPEAVALAALAALEGA